MRILLTATALTLLSFSAIAQQPPAPRNAPSTGTVVGEEIGRILFNVVERKAIEEFYGHIPSGLGGEVIKEVISTATTGQYSSTQQDDDNDDGRKGKKHKKNKGKNKGKNRGKNKKMPKGLAKRKSLPPGLQKQLDRNGSLPPGLAKRNLPTDLSRDLPPARQGTERVIAGNDVVLIHQATGVVLDILKNIVTK